MPTPVSGRHGRQNRAFDGREARAERRAKVWRYMVAGMRQAEIARQLGLNRQVVSADVARVLAEVQGETLTDAKTWRLELTAVAKAVRLANWKAMQDGDPAAGALVLKANEQLRDLWCPAKLQLTGEGDQPVSFTLSLAPPALDVSAPALPAAAPFTIDVPANGNGNGNGHGG